MLLKLPIMLLSMSISSKFPLKFLQLCPLLGVRYNYAIIIFSIMPEIIILAL